MTTRSRLLDTLARVATTLRRDRGATAVEYAIVVALISGVIVTTVLLVGLDTLENWGALSW